MSKQCCCGRYDLDEPLNVNGKIHEPIGQIGNFCGPESAHYIRDLRTQLTAALAERDEARKKVTILERHNSELTDERDRCLELATKNRQERDSLSAQVDTLNAVIKVYQEEHDEDEDTAWQQGAEAMREAVCSELRSLETETVDDCDYDDASAVCFAREAQIRLRALPVPERKEG